LGSDLGLLPRPFDKRSDPDKGEVLVILYHNVDEKRSTFSRQKKDFPKM